MVNTILLSAFGLLLSMRTAIVSSFRNERGQDLIEYALLGGLIAGGIVALGVGIYTGIVADMVDGIGDCVDFDTATDCAAGF